MLKCLWTVHLTISMEFPEIVTFLCKKIQCHTTVIVPSLGQCTAATQRGGYSLFFNFFHHVFPTFIISPNLFYTSMGHPYHHENPLSRDDRNHSFGIRTCWWKMRVCRNNTKMHSLRNDGRGSYLTTFFANPVVCSLEFKALQEFLQALLKITGSMIPAARGMMMFYDRVSFINELVIKKKLQRKLRIGFLANQESS